MKDIGKMISNMEKDKKLGQMDQSIKVNISKEKNMDMENTNGTTDLNIMVTGMKTKSKD